MRAASSRESSKKLVFKGYLLYQKSLTTAQIMLVSQCRPSDWVRAQTSNPQNKNKRLHQRWDSMLSVMISYTSNIVKTKNLTIFRFFLVSGSVGSVIIVFVVRIFYFLRLFIGFLWLLGFCGSFLLTLFRVFLVVVVIIFSLTFRFNDLLYFLLTLLGSCSLGSRNSLGTLFSNTIILSKSVKMGKMNPKLEDLS